MLIVNALSAHQHISSGLVVHSSLLRTGMCKNPEYCGIFHACKRSGSVHIRQCLHRIWPNKYCNFATWKREAKKRTRRMIGFCHSH